MTSDARSPVIRLDAADNVVVARIELSAGTAIESEGVTTLHDVPLGHKIATRAIRKGEPVLKYNTTIGFAGEDIAPGCWMHSHNVLMDEVQKDYRFAADYRPTELLPPEPWDETTWGAWTGAVKAATGRKGKALFLPLRLALTGLDHGPELKTLLPLIGHERAEARLAGKTA